MNYYDLPKEYKKIALAATIAAFPQFDKDRRELEKFLYIKNDFELCLDELTRETYLKSNY